MASQTSPPTLRTGNCSVLFSAACQTEEIDISTDRIGFRCVIRLSRSKGT